MLQRISLSILASFIAVNTMAQFKPQPKPALGTPQAKPSTTTNVQPVKIMQATQPKVATPPALSFKKINADLEYALVVDKPTSPRPQEGDMIKLHMVSICNGRYLYNTRTTNKNQPAEFSVNKPTFNADVIRAIQFMTPGDSLVCLVNAGEMFKNTKNKMPDFVKPTDKIQYCIKLVSVKTKEQYQKEQQVKNAKSQAEMNKKMQAQMDKQRKEQEKKQAAEDAILIPKEEAELQAYFTKNNVSPKKTLSGLYYTLNEKGSGDLPIKGDTAVMNYSGRLLDGTAFDSNVDTAFHHTTPFEFPLGQGRVIKGWDEGVALLPKGSKATFYIPSRLGYGANAQAKIPANSILIFDVELKDIKPVPVK